MAKLSFKKSADGGEENAFSKKSARGLRSASSKKRKPAPSADDQWLRLPSNAQLMSVITDTQLNNRSKDAAQIDEARKKFFALTQSRGSEAQVRLMSEYISSHDAEDKYVRMVSSFKPRSEKDGPHERPNESRSRKGKTKMRNKRKRQNRKAKKSETRKSEHKSSGACAEEAKPEQTAAKNKKLKISQNSDSSEEAWPLEFLSEKPFCVPAFLKTGNEASNANLGRLSP